MLIAIGAMLLALIIVTLFIFRDDLYEYSLNPRTPFQTFRLPMTPDYGSPEAWSAMPSRLDLADLAPRNASSAPIDILGNVDVFYIHPTTFADNSGWNDSIDGPAAEVVDSIILPNQAAAFNAAGRLFVPRFRQATLYSFRTRSNDARRALALAYQDVRRAFRNYLRYRAGKRAFILAGHGQGGLHVLGLLQDEVVDTPYQKRLVAAYVLGHPVPLDLFNGALRKIPACRSAADTGCLSSWSVYPEGADARTLTDRALVWENGRLTPVGERPILCTNPMSWRTDSTPVDRTHHMGALPLAAYTEGQIAPLMIPETTARCEDGILRISRPIPRSLRRSAFPGRPFHQLDVNMFFGNLRANAALRAAIFLNTTES